jgi:hypothetical protein
MIFYGALDNFFFVFFVVFVCFVVQGFFANYLICGVFNFLKIIGTNKGWM